MKDTIFTQLGDAITTIGDSITIICDKTVHVSNEHISWWNEMIRIIHLFNTDMLLLIAAILVALGILAIPSVSKWFTKRLYLIAGFVLFCGFILYLDGFNDKGCENNPVALVTRASISALEMFASHSDLIEVRHELHENHLYMTMFSVVHFSAVLVSAIFVINLFGLRFRNWLRKQSWKSIDCKRNECTYIFWGINNESLALARDIIHKPDNSGRIVFIYTPIDNAHEHSEHHFSFSKLFDFTVNLKNEIEYIVLNLNGYVLKFNTVESLRSIHFLLKQEVHILFLSNDEENNLNDLFSIKALDILKNSNVTFYCHAQKKLLNERLISCSMCEKNPDINHQIKLIDSSYLSILELKHSFIAHPVNFVDIETDENGYRTGIVISPFNALIVGFGDTGQEALSFLYEFSAFVGRNGGRSSYHIAAIDKYMDNIQGDYIAQRPAIKDNKHIEFVCTDIHTSTYWNIIDKLVAEGLNYIVVALGDDKQNLSVAIQLQEYIMRKVNSEGCATKCGRFCIYFKQRQGIDNKLCLLYGNANLRPFGQNENIFTWDIVSNSKYQIDADQYGKRYDRLKKENKYEDCDDGAVKDEVKVKTDLEKMRDKERKYSQNLSNAYHIATKIHLMGEERISSLQKHKRYPLNVKDYKGEYQYKVDEVSMPDYDVTTLMTTIAQCEHLRWNAAIEMLGYTQNLNDRSSCNLITMEHNCLTSWDDLDRIWRELKGKKQYCEYKLYDYSVVETSIKLYLEKSLERKANDGQRDN